MLTAIYQMAVLLLITAAGYVGERLGYLDKHTQSTMSKLLVNVAMPLLILHSVNSMDLAAVGSQVLPAFGFGTLLFFASLGAGVVCVFVCRIPKGQWRPCLFCSFFSNLAFIGIAVAQALFGGASVLYVSIFILMGNVFMFSIGMVILGGHMSGPADVLRSCVNPPMVACILAIILLFAGVKLPGVLDSACSMVGQMTAPLAMMIVGAIVAGSSLKSVFSEWKLYPLTLLRQLVFPLLAWLALRGLGIDATLLATFIAMFGMPVGAMAASMCDMQGVDGSFAAKYTIVSTVLSFVTLPVLIGVM